MIRLGIICEGKCEELLGDTIIQPHLLAKGIYSFSTQIVTKRKASQKDSKGGMPSYERVRDDILRHLKGDPNLYLTSMFDLYAISTNFPSYHESCKIPDPYQRVRFLENAFAKNIGCNRFIPYIQLHEFEALIFSDIEIAHDILSLEDSKVALKGLEKIIHNQPNPEFINNGPNTAPSKRILSLYPDYQKTIDGIRALKHIGLAKIRGKCAHFDEWLTRLEFLVLNTGNPTELPIS